MIRKFKYILPIVPFLVLTAASFKYGGIKHDITVTAKSAGTTTLTASSSQVQAFTGTSAQTVDLPSGLSLKNGYWYIVSNEGTAGDISVRDASASILATLAASQSATFYMKNDAVIGGNWSVQKGGGSGGGSTSPLTTKGDLWGFDTADARVPVGADGTFLAADSASASGVAYKYVDAVRKSIAQTAHGFSVGNIVYDNAGTWTLAKADADATSEVVGIVSSVTDADNFVLTTSGYVSGLSGLTAHAIHYLSDSSAGALTATEPTTAGHISKPVLFADSTTSGYFSNMRGAEVQSQGTNQFIPTYTADIAAPSAGACVVTEKNGQDWINGNATSSGTGLCAITFNTGIFSNTPGCQVSINESGGYGTEKSVTETTSGVTTRVFDTSSQGAVSKKITISCTGR